jgi:hypothetical protein
LKGTGAAAVSELENTGSKLLVRLIELAVLCAAFFIACQLFAVDTVESFFMHTAIYSTLVILSIILSQRWFCTFKTIGEVSRYILANAVGILAGTCGVLILQSAVSTSGGFSAVVIFLSTIFFFALGAISSMVHSGSKLCKPQGHFLNRQWYESRLSFPGSVFGQSV